MRPYAFRELKVWQRSMELTLEIYRLTKDMPANERFGLAMQLRRAAASVPTNIAEGNGRAHRGDYLRFLSIARASLMEVDSILELAERLDYFCDAQLRRARALVSETRMMLSALTQSLSRTIPLHSSLPES